MKIMEKKTYIRPSIAETKLDAEINVLMDSTPPVNFDTGMSLDQSNETNGDMISQFMNPLKWFR